MQTKREMLEQRFKQLRAIRATWEPAWKDISEHLLPYAPTWEARSPNHGTKKDQKILNSKPLRSVKTLAAGMMAGITSPARDWFRLGTSDPELNEYKSVKVYLDKCEQIIAAKLHASSFYRAMSGSVRPEQIVLGTAVLFEEEGRPGEVRFRPSPAGEYFLDINADGRVDTCFRELAMTARQMVQKFGHSKVSANCRRAYDERSDTAMLVRHAVLPNSDYKHGRIGKDGMPWSSCWWEAADERLDGMLEEKGYHEFPVMAPRWSAPINSAYGYGPGWEARGDCKVLQHHERQYLKLYDKVVDPPMRSSDKMSNADLRPGSVTHVAGQGGVYEPAIEMAALPRAMAEAKERIAEIERRISEAMFEHLWNMLIQDERAQRPTATEIEAKRQEVALMLGPVLENDNAELLEPVIERTYAILERNNMLPLPPPELEGQDVKVEFISIMHQMQQTTGLVSVRTLINEVSLMAQVRPDVLDKVDFDIVVDEYARITGIRPDAVLSKDEVAKVRGQRAQQEQAKQEGEAMLAATQGIRNVSGADPAKLSELAGMMSPVAAAQGGALGSVKAA